MFRLCDHMRQFIGLICLFCFAKTSPSVNDYHVPRVVNGKEANLGQIPYQVALKLPYNRNNGLYATFCGATIIGHRKILTAGHCFVRENEPLCDKYFRLSKNHVKLSDVYAVAGTLTNKGMFRTDSEGTEQWREIRVVAIPRIYNFPNSDIAVAFTKEPFVFNKYVGAVPYATRYVDYGDMQCTVSGYGNIADNVPSETLVWANLTLIPSRWCSDIHAQNMDQFICTSSRISSVLKGDSGGPLVCHNTTDPNEDQRGVLVGVVSGLRWGAGTFFTRVSNYKGFVTQGFQDASSMLKGSLCIVMACITALSVLFLFYLYFKKNL